MKKIKVLHISETFAAGVYTYIKDICQYFDSVSEIESFVIYSGKRKDTIPSKFSQDFSTKTTLIEVNMSREISFLKDFKSVIVIAQQIKKIKPDVIHLHSSKAGILGRIASKRYLKSKIYYTPNGYSFVREDISDLKKKLFYAIEKLTNKLFGGITIACGDTEYEHAKKIGKALLVRNGIDVKSLRNLKCDKKSKSFTIGTMGRLSPQKNPKLFNEIALQFPNIEFVWIGDGELKPEITSKNIFVSGWMPREKALKMMNNFDIYVQTSSWEGLPFTIIEAMVLGKPIIATNVIGNKDAVFPEENGYVCNSLKDFINNINSLSNNEVLLEKMGSKSYEIACELFDRNKNFEKLVSIYKNNY